MTYSMTYASRPACCCWLSCGVSGAACTSAVSAGVQWLYANQIQYSSWGPYRASFTNNADIHISLGTRFIVSPRISSHAAITGQCFMFLYSSLFLRPLTAIVPVAGRRRRIGLVPSNLVARCNDYWLKAAVLSGHRCGPAVAMAPAWRLLRVAAASAPRHGTPPVPDWPWRQHSSTQPPHCGLRHQRPGRS